MNWDEQAFVSQLEGLFEAHIDEPAQLQQGLSHLYSASAVQIADDELADLSMGLLQTRGQKAAFRARLRARWGYALDLFELLLARSGEIGQGTREQYGPIAVESGDHRFEALSRLHAKATLTASEILALLETGHSAGAMARWRTLHEVDSVAAFLRMNSDTISYRYLRHEDAQTLKIRRSYDQYQDQLGYEPAEYETDGDPTQLKEAVIEEFGSDFLQPNGWAIPAFGRRPTQAQIEEAADLQHYRPFYYLASDTVHATPKGLIFTIQQVGEDPMLMPGPSNAGLTDPAHNAALSLVRCTLTWINYSAMDLDPDPGLDEQVSVLLTSHFLLEMTKRIGDAFYSTGKRLEEEHEAVEEGLIPPA